MKYTKIPLSFEEQILLLQQRGLIIEDIEKAKNYLSNINYYRFSAYMLPFQQKNTPNDPFIEKTTFNQVLELYLFDREFRILVFDAIERLEIAFRTQIIYQYSVQSGDAWWFEDPKSGKIWHYNFKALKEQLNKLEIVFEEGFVPKKDAEKDK